MHLLHFLETNCYLTKQPRWSGQAGWTAITVNQTRSPSWPINIHGSRIKHSHSTEKGRDKLQKHDKFKGAKLEEAIWKHWTVVEVKPCNTLHE